MHRNAGILLLKLPGIKLLACLPLGVVPPPRRSADVPVIHQATRFSRCGVKGVLWEVASAQGSGEGWNRLITDLYMTGHYMPTLIVLGDGILLGWFLRSKRKLFDVKWY